MSNDIDPPEAPLHLGEAVRVRVNLGGDPGPHNGYVSGLLSSGRIKVHIWRGGSLWRVVTEACNVYSVSRPALASTS